jgi:hypothetical protein
MSTLHGQALYGYKFKQKVNLSRSKNEKLQENQ